jgi:hypothetical protein
MKHSINHSRINTIESEFARVMNLSEFAMLNFAVR